MLNASNGCNNRSQMLVRPLFCVRQNEQCRQRKGVVFVPHSQMKLLKCLFFYGCQRKAAKIAQRQEIYLRIVFYTACMMLTLRLIGWLLFWHRQPKYHQFITYDVIVMYYSGHSVFISEFRTPFAVELLLISSLGASVTVDGNRFRAIMCTVIYVVDEN